MAFERGHVAGNWGRRVSSALPFVTHVRCLALKSEDATSDLEGRLAKPLVTDLTTYPLDR